MGLEHTLLLVTIACYAACWLLYAGTLARPSPALDKGATGLGLLAFVSHCATLATRTVVAERLPFASLYESLLIFTCGIALVALWLVWYHRTGALVLAAAPIIALGLLYANTVSADIKPLPPILRSPWLAIHVGLAIVAYSGFALSGALGCLLLCKEALEQAKHRLSARLPQPETLDHLTYQIMQLALPFMVLVLVTGSIWASQAWGTYWQWDPKETWGLITTVVYGIGLNQRHQGKLALEKGAWFALLGWILVLFCYLGVNLLMPGLHSYASN